MSLCGGRAAAPKSARATLLVCCPGVTARTRLRDLRRSLPQCSAAGAAPFGARFRCFVAIVLRGPGPLVVNNGQALLAAALAGVGIAVQADALLDAAIARGELVRLLPRWSLPSRALHVVRLPQARPSAKLRTFVDHAVEHLG